MCDVGLLGSGLSKIVFMSWQAVPVTMKQAFLVIFEIFLRLPPS